MLTNNGIISCSEITLGENVVLDVFLAVRTQNVKKLQIETRFDFTSARKPKINSQYYIKIHAGEKFS